MMASFLEGKSEKDHEAEILRLRPEEYRAIHMPSRIHTCHQDNRTLTHRNPNRGALFWVPRSAPVVAEALTFVCLTIFAG